MVTKVCTVGVDMAEGNALRSVTDALAEVTRRQEEQSSRHSSELAEVDQELESLRTAMANLQQQIEALSKFREELLTKAADSGAGSLHRKTYDAIFETLRSHAEALSGRAAELAEVHRAREQALSATLEDEAVQKLLVEFEQFKTQVEPTLHALPESYRSVLESHHAEVEEKLREHLGEHASGPATLDAEPLHLDVVVATDAPEGVVEVILLVLPVVEQVQTAWAEREEDLQTWVAARVMQAVYQVCQELGLAGAQAMYGGHQGLLAVEVELGATDPEGVRATLVETIDRMLAEASELAAAQVRLSARPVDVDHLFPPEDEALEAPPAGPPQTQEVSSAQ